MSENISNKISEWILNFKTERTGTELKPNQNFKIPDWILHSKTETECRVEANCNLSKYLPERPNLEAVVELLARTAVLLLSLQ